MGEKRFAKKPLLYIEQPTVSEPEAPMQHHYMTPINDQSNIQSRSTNQKQNKPVRSRRIQRKYYADTDEEIEEVEEVNEEQMNEQENKESSSKRFKDMNLEEKVEYFLTRSSHLPELKCEIKTNDNNYRGIITDFHDETVFIRVGRRKSSTSVLFDDIEDIQLLGF